jgi:VWFA-related protein
MFLRLRGTLAWALCPAMALGQATPTTAPDRATIRVNSRIVYVDVVVRDSQGQVVHGLTESDFKLTEDGVPQRVDYFNEHRYSAADSAKSVPPKTEAATANGVAEFRNTPEAGAVPGAINVILFDLQDTPVQDQLQAKQALLKFLTSMPPGQQVALFVLSDDLRMYQNFTASSDRLIEAAKAINPKDLHLIESKVQMQQDADFVTAFAQAIGRSPGGAAESLKAHNDDDRSFNRNARTVTALGALGEIARATSGYPGRKNLLWLSESFPITVGVEAERARGGTEVTLTEEREVLNLIASAQIAVYPISLLGLEVGGVSAASSGLGSVSLIGSPTGSTTHPQANDTDRDQFDQRAALRAGMNQLADQTGGDSFVGTNDFARALRMSMVDGSNYYSLAYSPQNQKWNGQFRKVKVELAKKGYSLAYRRGYFAFDTTSSASGAQALNLALQPSTPEATMLLLKSKVNLPAAEGLPVKVTSSLDPGNLTLVTTTDGHRRGRVMVMLVAFNDGPGPNGQQQPDAPPQTSGVLNLDFDAGQYQAVVTNGISFAQQLKLKPGRYRLRLGVSDLLSRRIGTLDMPIEVGDATVKGQ